MSESNRIEYKRELTDTLEREAVAFLNYRDGGVIYVGVDDHGQALEITSAGGLPQGLNQAEFFQGFSVPRNKEIMRVFKDLELVEYLGSGLPRILKAYPPEVYSFSENFLRMVFPYEGTELVFPEAPPELGEKLGEKLGETRYAILSRIQQSPEITIVKLAQELGLSTTAVEKQIGLLKEQGYLKRIGPTKGGYWEVVDG